MLEVLVIMFLFVGVLSIYLFQKSKKSDISEIEIIPDLSRYYKSKLNSKNELSYNHYDFKPFRKPTKKNNSSRLQVLKRKDLI